VQVAKLSAEATTGDEGIEWIKNEPYDNTDGAQATQQPNLEARRFAW
jgi:hypothetical protein